MPVRTPSQAKLLAAQPTLTAGDMRLFQDLIYHEAGIRLPDVKVNLVQGRLRKRLEALGLGTYRDYHTYVCRPGNEAERQCCIEELTTNETFFFRHKQHWDFLLEQIVPEWRKTVPAGAAFRAWSAASSTGEEPYSLAIALTAALAGTGHATAIDATDINTQVLAEARTGVYGDYALQKLTPACLRDFFIPAGEGLHRVVDDIRALVQFRQHNLLEPTTGPFYDLILIRNVLIYFDNASKAIVLRHVTARLKPGGWLILGGAETLGQDGDSYAYVRPTIYRKR